jgi:serine/threonine kinase PknH
MAGVHGSIRVAAILAAGAVALPGCSSNSTPSKASSTPAAPTSATSQATTTTTTTSAPPTVAPDHLSSILLVPQEADPIMGATGMTDLGGMGSTDPNAFEMSNPDCLGAAHIVQPPVYADSGYTAILFDVLHEPGNRYTHSIEQAVTSYPSAQQAAAFVTAQAGKWKACAGQNVTDSLKGANSYWTFGDFAGDVPKIALRYNRLNARGWACQRVLNASLNVVIDVKACSFKIGDEGIQVADKIASKANQ